MNAIQPTQLPPSEPGGSLRRVRRPRRRVVRNANPHQVLMWEVCGKVAVSSGLAILAAFGLVRLIPNTLAQQEQLEHLSQEVTALEQRVETLQSGFSDRFDPQQAQRVMQEQSNQIAPGQVQVIWINPSQQQATAVPTVAPVSP